MHIFWKNEEGNLVTTTCFEGVDAFEEARRICPVGTAYIVAEDSKDLDWNKPTGYGS